jgi:phage tail sheath protein FI
MREARNAFVLTAYLCRRAELRALGQQCECCHAESSTSQPAQAFLMPEYLAPGVYIEEVPTCAKPIEGVDTSTAGFVGAAQSGPLDVAIGPLSSFAAFERHYGNGSALSYPGSPPVPAFLWHAARTFFLEGGTQLWVARVSRSGGGARPRRGDFERGLSALDAVPEVAMIAAPGSTFDGGDDSHADALAIATSLITHAERMRYRIAVIDSPEHRASAGVAREIRGEPRRAEFSLD